MVARRKLTPASTEDLRLAAVLLSGGDEPELWSEERPGYIPAHYARMPRTSHSARSTTSQHVALAKLCGMLAAGQCYVLGPREHN